VHQPPDFVPLVAEDLVAVRAAETCPVASDSELGQVASGVVLGRELTVVAASADVLLC